MQVIILIIIYFITPNFTHNLKIAKNVRGQPLANRGSPKLCIKPNAEPTTAGGDEVNFRGGEVGYVRRT